MLYKDANTGAIALAMDPANPTSIYAALWQTRRPPWNVYPPSNGPGSGLYKSTDGGATLDAADDRASRNTSDASASSISPAAPHARVRQRRQRSPATAESIVPTTRGATWTHTDGRARIWQRGWYFGGITADPQNPDVVYVMNTATYRSHRRRKNFDAIHGDPGGDDYHTLWIDPNDSDRMILGSDQGVDRHASIGAQTWSSWYNQPTAQFYHVITDDAFPYFVYGAQQDSGAAIAPSRSKYGDDLATGFSSDRRRRRERHARARSAATRLVYGDSSGQGGPTVTHEIRRPDGSRTSIRSSRIRERSGATRGRCRSRFLPPTERALLRHQNIFRSRDGGKTWTIVSPDLPRANEGTPVESRRSDARRRQRHRAGTASSTRSRRRRCAPN